MWSRVRRSRVWAVRVLLLLLVLLLLMRMLVVCWALAQDWTRVRVRMQLPAPVLGTPVRLERSVGLAVHRKSSGG